MQRLPRAAQPHPQAVYIGYPAVLRWHAYIASLFWTRVLDIRSGYWKAATERVLARFARFARLLAFAPTQKRTKWLIKTTGGLLIHGRLREKTLMDSDWCRMQHTSAIFKVARDSFFNTLSDEQKIRFAPFDRPELMIRSIQAECERNVVNNGRFKTCIERISIMSERIGPFFDIVGIFVSSNPEYAALVWGAVRLIFLVHPFSNLREFYRGLT
jgi:hypothetical protein